LCIVFIVCLVFSKEHNRQLSGNIYQLHLFDGELKHEMSRTITKTLY